MGEKYSVGLYVGAFCPARSQFGVLGHLMEPPANRLAMYFVYSEVVKRKPDLAWGENCEQNKPVQQPAPPREPFASSFRGAREGGPVSPGAAPVAEALKKAMVGVDKQ